ncbi:DUF1648 domain-containing protein [Flavobacterium sp.]|uniref:DUF1648 domain-containing protein n=1 Tax=Flavobacterium sp. TaxID=239 RepID=UPI00391AA930
MSDSKRPIVKIPLTLFDKSAEVIGLLILLSFWIFTLFYYNQLPEIIPTHFGAEGKPDGFGPKWTIVILPLISTFIYVFLTIVVRFPHKMNYTATITETNAEKQYTTMTKMLRMLKLMLLLVFFVIDYKTMQIALEWPDVFGRWFLLLVFTLVFVPIFYFLIQSSKNS